MCSTHQQQPGSRLTAAMMQARESRPASLTAAATNQGTDEACNAAAIIQLLNLGCLSGANAACPPAPHPLHSARMNEAPSGTGREAGLPRQTNSAAPHTAGGEAAGSGAPMVAKSALPSS